MAVNLKGRDFLKLLDFSEEEILYLLDLAADLKDKKKKGIPHRICEGRNIALIFEKTSTRTRCSFEVAGHDLGMGTTYLDPSGSQIGKKESIADTARRSLRNWQNTVRFRSGTDSPTSSIPLRCWRICSRSESISAT